MLTTIFVEPRHLFGFAYSNCLTSAGHDLAQVAHAEAARTRRTAAALGAAALALPFGALWRRPAPRPARRRRPRSGASLLGRLGRGRLVGGARRLGGGLGARLGGASARRLGCGLGRLGGGLGLGSVDLGRCGLGARRRPRAPRRARRQRPSVSSIVGRLGAPAPPPRQRTAWSFARSCRHLDRLAAVAADAHPAAVVEDGVPDAGRLLAARADEHHLRDVQRLGDVEDAALLDLRGAVGPALGLAGLGVALGDVEALDRRPRPVAPRRASSSRVREPCFGRTPRGSA